MPVQKIGTDAGETIVVQATDLPAGIFDGKGGVDTLQLTGVIGQFALSFDLSTAATLTNFEILRGTTTTDYITLTAAQVTGITTFDTGGAGYIDFIEIKGSAVDLRNKIFQGGKQDIRLLTDGCEVTVNSTAVASLIRGSSSRQEAIKAEGIVFTAAERKALHESGIDRLVDASGIVTVDAAPVVTGLAGDATVVLPSQLAWLDVGQNAAVSEEYGFFQMDIDVSDRNSGGKLNFDTSGSVKVAGIFEDIFVNGINIGNGWQLGSSRLSVNFNEKATPALVQELIRALTYQNSSSALPLNGQDVITLDLKDQAWRSSTSSVFVRYSDAGANIAKGGIGRDTLKAGLGADTLIGGKGADRLVGGGDRDIFVYSSIKDSTVAASGRDVIYDFSHSQKDRVDLKTIDARTTAKGNQAFKFIGKQDFHHRAGELRFEKGKVGAYVYGDVNGDGKADFSIILKGVPSLVKGDFYL